MTYKFFNRLCVTTLIGALLALLFACQADKNAQPKDERTKGKNALEVAVLPTLEAVPLYYAVENGLADSLGLSLVLRKADSQMIMSELLQKKGAEVGMFDFVRIAYHRGKGENLKLFATMQGEVGIVACKALRMKKVAQIDERTLAVERFSMLDLVREQVQETAKLPYDRVLVAQINSYPLRTMMLDGNQIDGAVLPQPYLQMAQAKGHSLLTPKLSQWRLGFVASDSVLGKEKKRLKLLVKVYDAGVSALNAQPDTTILRRIETLLDYPQGVLNSKQQYAKLQSPTLYKPSDLAPYFERRKGSKKGLDGAYSTSVMP